jgi:spore maturation protein CgeB
VRVLAVAPGPAFSVQDVHAGWVEALRGFGVHVSEFNLDERLSFYSQAQLDRGDGPDVALTDAQAKQLAVNGLFSACYQLVPDVLLVTSGFFVPTKMLDLIRSRGTKVVLIHTEEPYEHDRDITRAAHADVNIVNDPTHLDEFTAFGDAWYQPHCYRPDVHKPGPVQAEAASDFCIVGTGYPSRVEFLEQVDFDGVDVALAGNWQATGEDSPLRKYLAHDIDACVDNTEAVTLYQSTKISANLYRREANAPHLSAGWSMGPREVELAATGCFFLRDPRGESDAVLGMLPLFTSPGEFGDLIRWHLQHPDVRARLAEQARTAIADRTFTNAARRLLTHLG